MTGSCVLTYSKSVARPCALFIKLRWLGTSHSLQSFSDSNCLTRNQLDSGASRLMKVVGEYGGIIKYHPTRTRAVRWQQLTRPLLAQDHEKRKAGCRPDVYPSATLPPEGRVLIAGDASARKSLRRRVVWFEEKPAYDYRQHEQSARFLYRDTACERPDSRLASDGCQFGC